MIPIFRAPVMLGRDGEDKAPVRYVAFVTHGDGSTSLWSSDDLSRFTRRRIKGDLAQWAATGTLLPYTYGGILKASNGWLYAAFRHTTPGALVSRGLLFRSQDGLTWNRVSHPLDGVATGSYLVDVAEGAGVIAALRNDGQLVVSSDGETFVLGANTGIAQANGLAGSPDRLVAAGNGGLLKETANPLTSWTNRDPKFSGTSITGLHAGNVFLASGTGGKIATAPLSNPATWTLRSTGSEGLFVPMYRPDRWFIAGFNTGVLVTATDALSFSTTTSFAAAGERVGTAINDDEGLVVFFGEGKIARNTSGTTWTVMTDTGLPDNMTIRAAAFLG